MRSEFFEQLRAIARCSAAECLHRLANSVPLRNEAVIREHQCENARAETDCAVTQPHDGFVAPLQRHENLNNRLEAWNVLEQIDRNLRHTFSQGSFLGCELLPVIELFAQLDRQ